MDSYQAIYDAVRSKISGGDISSAVHDVLWQQFDVSHQKALLQEQIGIVGDQMSRPSAIYRPRVMIDGNQWCALYGDNLQDGVAGFGDTPDLSMSAFDKAWHTALASKAPASSDKGGR